MAIKDRELKAGSVLEGSYKKLSYRCRVEAEDEKLVFVLEDGRRFKSVSAAASAVMDGKAVNGWLFWTPQEAEAVKDKPKPRKAKTFGRVPNQRGVSEGKVRFWCNACMKSFEADDGTEPESCPAGHTAAGSV